MCTNYQRSNVKSYLLCLFDIKNYPQNTPIVIKFTIHVPVFFSVGQNKIINKMLVFSHLLYTGRHLIKHLGGMYMFKYFL